MTEFDFVGHRVPASDEEEMMYKVNTHSVMPFSMIHEARCTVWPNQNVTYRTLEEAKRVALGNQGNKCIRYCGHCMPTEGCACP